MLERHRPASRATAKSPAEERGPARSHLIGTITRAAIGPFAAVSDDGGLAAWIVNADRGGGAELVVLPFGADGAPLRDPQIVAHVPTEATSLIVRPTHRSRGGWFVGWTALLDRGESFSLVEVGSDGTARDKPSDVQRTNDHMAWADIVTTPHGTLCVWAEETVAGNANMLAASIGSDGKAHGMPVRVARGVARWAGAGTDAGVGLAVVARAYGDTKGAAGRLSFLGLDGEGAARGAAIPIGSEPTASGDVDIVAVSGGWLLAWTDRTGEDARVMLASVDATGHVVGPSPALNEVGGSSLVALAAGAGGVALAWESPHATARPTHLVHLASVSTTGTLTAQPITSLAVVGQAPVELVSTADGFAILTTPAPVCSRTDDSAPADCSAFPTFVRYDARLVPVQTEPLLVGDTRASAALAWNLRCETDRCIVLAATGDAPTPVFAVDLVSRSAVYAAPVAPTSPPDAPRPTGIDTLASGLAYADVAAVRVGASTLVATMTNGVDDPKAPAGSRAATVALRAYDDSGRPIEAIHTLTSRALPVGRIALAASKAGGDRAEEAAAAWVVRDAGDPQVHVATVDARGHRIKEVQLTTAQGDAGDVAVTWAGGGWVVAWVDWRDGNGDVYAAKLDRDLVRVSPEQRLTRAPGDASDVALASEGDTVWLAWSDPRESPREGLGDVYVTSLAARDAKRTTDEVRLLATAAHSRSPEVVAVAGGAVVAWIEDAPPGVDAPGAALFARVDAKGHVVDTGRVQLGDDGRPTAIALEVAGSGVRAAVARAGHGVVTLDAATLPMTGPSARAWPLADLDAPGAFDVSLTLAGGALVYDDVGATGAEHRVRRMAIAW